MLEGNGLQPSSKGARIRFAGDKRTVIDGPFAETKELVAGYWLIQVKSLAEAIETRHSLLRDCIRTLAAPSRDLLRWRYDTGLSLRDVAQKLGRTEAAVQVALSRVRKWLVDCIAKRAQTGAEVSP